MELGRDIVKVSLDHPKALLVAMVVLTLALGAMIPWVQVDTDPENMLAESEPVRVFHNQMKDEFGLYDMVVLGIVNESDPDGVFNPGSLQKVYELTQFAKSISWPDPDDPDKEIVPVVEIDILAPSEVDDIRPKGGVLDFSYLMKKPPESREAARDIRDRAKENPLLDGTVVSEDGKAICLYFPLKSKDYSYRVSTRLQEKIDTFEGPEEYHITGLPVAEDTFGVQMFIQMAISAPMAMLVIFILMFAFFRSGIVVLSAMIDAMIAVVCTMGLMIGLGYTVHIMSSMIPIFVMPIAVLDDVHVLSEFFDRYGPGKKRSEVLAGVIDELFVPMLYTTLTTMAGFASLALAPIPPVQVFGLFVAFGVLVAWVCSVMVVPAYIMLLPQKVLDNFGAAARARRGKDSEGSGLAPALRWLGGFAYRRVKLIIGLTALATGIAIYGITLIRINDNPVKWFEEEHPIRVADRVLNEHFGGTYMAYLVLESEQPERAADQVQQSLTDRLDKLVKDMGQDWPELGPVAEDAKSLVSQAASEAEEGATLLDRLSEQVARRASETDNLDVQDAWKEVAGLVDLEKLAGQTFKRPEPLRYMDALQKNLAESGVVGKSNSLADLVKKLHKEIRGGAWDHFTVPDSPSAVAQLLLQYESSHNYDDLWHLTEKPDETAGKPGYRKVSIWVQLKSGDNREMERVVQRVDHFLAENAPPVELKHRWFGLTYINVVWQDKMVWGMLQAFLGSFLIVFAMMTVLFRSPLWGILCMVPLTVTIALIYGVVGLVGKDYDMPVAVLSALTLGLAVDFAIHFLARSRAAVDKHGSWADAAKPMFGEPARAITRNIIVIAVGFLPLLLAPLVPYQTVGFLMASILAVSGVATLFVLAALVSALDQWLFRETAPVSAPCNCAVCFATSAALVILVALTVHQFSALHWSTLTIISIVAIPVLALLCGRLSRREACKRQEETDNDEGAE